MINTILVKLLINSHIVVQKMLRHLLYLWLRKVFDIFLCIRTSKYKRLWASADFYESLFLALCTNSQFAIYEHNVMWWYCEQCFWAIVQIIQVSQDFITMEVPVIDAIETSKAVDEKKGYLLIAYRFLTHNIWKHENFNVTETIIQ